MQKTNKVQGQGAAWDIAVQEQLLAAFVIYNPIAPLVTLQSKTPKPETPRCFLSNRLSPVSMARRYRAQESREWRWRAP